MANISKAPRRPWMAKVQAYQESPERLERKKFYQTKRWRTLRANFIRSNPLCRKCQEKGITKSAAVVDHIVPIYEGGDEVDESNLQSLCNSCHMAKSGAEGQRYKKNIQSGGGG